MASLVDTAELDSLGDLFLDQQIQNLRLSDQRHFFDALASRQQTERRWHPGDRVSYNDGRWWIDAIEEGDLLLKNGERITYRPPGDKALKPVAGNRLLELAGEKKERTPHDERAFRLRQTAFELRYRDTRRYASLKGSRIQILPHQLQAVERVIQSLTPRFLIADEVGLGKTIETGLLIKEFAMRYRYRHMIVVAPASLLLQWQNELREKFSEDFSILDKRAMDRAGDLHAFIDKNPRVLVSLDFAKQESVAEGLAKRIWDLVVFDEAHRLRRDRQKITRAWAFADALSVRTKSLLLLSATPFSGKIEELYFFTSLLDKTKIGSLHSFEEAYFNKGGAFLGNLLSELTIRRTKREVGGFTRRQAFTQRYRLTGPEKAFYDQLSEYVQTEYRRAIEHQKENGAKASPRALMLTFFQKMMDSSMAAILSALGKRIAAIEAAMEKARSEQATARAAADTLSGIEDDMDADDEAESAAAAAETLDDLRSELFFLQRVHALGRDLRTDSKSEELVRLLRHIWKSDPAEKIVLFTQFKSTMFHLEKLFADVKPLVFHGSMSLEEKDAAIEAFRRDRVLLLSTEAGGEGRNLQCARILVNYDLPWNPFKLEQRIGRIHRFGQKHDVNIYNFVLEASIGERILEILEEKIKVFEDAFGETEALLGMVDGGGRDFERLFMKMLAKGEDAGAAVEQRLSISREKLKRLAVTSQMLAETPVKPEAVRHELSQLADKLQSFFLDYAPGHPEDFVILETRTVSDFGLYRLQVRRDLCETDWVTFDVRALHDEALPAEGFPHRLTPLHLEHPLVKRMIERSFAHSLEHAVLGRRPGGAGESIRFSFVLTFDSFKTDERSLEIVLPWGEASDAGACYAEAADRVREVLEREKKDLTARTTRLVDAELGKIRESHERQIRETEELLATYEMKNKQLGGDHYFLLIPKVRKHLQQLRRDFADVSALTREKLEIRADFWLFSVAVE